MKAKSCRSGYYWCFDDKKCKKIPLGYHIGARGYLYPDKDDDGNSDGNGNGKNGNGNGSNHSGNSGSNGGSGGGVSEGTTMQENFKRINQNGQTYAVMLQFRGRTYNIQMFIPKQTRPTRLEVQREVNKIYPGSIVRYFEPRVWDPASPALVMPEQMQPGAKDLVQQSNYMKPALQQKKQKKPVKNDCGCKEEFTLKKVNEIVDPMTPKKREEIEKIVKKENEKPDWMKVLDALKPKPVYKENLTYDIDPKKHKKERRDAKIGNLARKTTNPGEKSAAEKKSKGPKLFGEDTVRVEGQLGYVEFIDLIKPEPMKGIAERKLTKGEEEEKERVVKGMKKSFKGFRERYGPDAKSVMYATATKLAKEETGIGPSRKERIEKSDEMQNPKPILQRVLNTVEKIKGKNGVKEEVIDERLGGKGYKPYTSMSGEKVSGDWEDSDRGSGNRATKRAGGKVKKKSPTYQAYVLNKEEVVMEKEDSPYEKASSGALKGKTRNTEAKEKEHKTSFRRKAHRNSAAMIIKAKRKAERSGKKLSDDSAADLAHKGWASSVKHHKSSMTPEQQKRRQKLADTPYKKLSKDEQEKDKVSAKAIMSVHDKQTKKEEFQYISNKIKEQLAPHIKKGVAAAKPLVKAQALQTGLPTTKEKPKPPEKKDSKSIFSQLTNKDEID